MLVFIVEAVSLCLIFTLLILVNSKNPINDINNYPTKIIERCKELNLITDNQLPRSKKVVLKKLIVAICFMILFIIILKFINKANIFKDGFLISYGLWLAVDWYDAFILDCLWFCHSKRFVIPGTEDMVDEYHNYKFHIIGSLKGMIIGLPVCLLVGLFIQVL